jgi:transposase-like protein
VLQECVDLEQFHLLYPTEETCADSLYASKWPHGFRCPECNHPQACRITTRRLPLYECRSCHHQTSLLAGTIMSGSRTPLLKWFLAFFLVSRTEQGTNAVQLRFALCVTYKTAWLILSKIRYAMSQADSATLLTNIVQVNIATYGRPYNPTVYYHPQEHPLWVAASLNEEGKPQYVKIKKIYEEAKRDRAIFRRDTETFIQKHVNPHAEDIQFVTGRFSSSRFKQLISLQSQANKWINMTFHGLGPKHLQAYFDEFTFRLNLTLSQKPIFRYLFLLCSTSPSTTYTQLTR